MVARTDSRITGLARYVYSLYDAFSAVSRPVSLMAPLIPPLPEWAYALLARRGVDLRTLFTNYPVRADLSGADVCHITSQNLATLLLTHRVPNAVVTVHDLHHLIERVTNRAVGGVVHWMDRLAIAGARRAQHLIAISEYTKRSIVELLHYPEERISVIHRAVDMSVFKPLVTPVHLRARYGLPPGALLVLYVGSEDPRKNLATLLEAFRHVRARIPSAVLVKAGAVHTARQAAELRQRARDLGIAPSMVFIEQISDADLPALYNTADICVLPSLLEGFGLPALEAMACGRPVIASNATSLPEVIGAAGVLFDPRRPDELAAAIVRLLEYPEERHRLGELAIARARTFSLTHQAEQTWEVYCRVFATQDARVLSGQSTEL
jgi:glycosyltransferase involved in cell wall biosynthesis